MPAIGILVLTALMTLPATSAAQAQSGAKTLFYNSSGATAMPKESPPPASLKESRATPSKTSSRSGTAAATVTKKPAAPTEEYVGISYWVELLTKSGETQRVTTDRVFRAGERIRLHVLSNRDGFLYLINIGSTGRSTVLFPSVATTPARNAVRAGEPVIIPSNGQIRFDDNPGEESLLFVFSPAFNEDALPGRPTVSALPEDVARFLADAEARGAKDLVLEVDAADTRPAAYAVAPSTSMRDGRLVIVRVALTHR